MIAPTRQTREIGAERAAIYVGEIRHEIRHEIVSSEYYQQAETKGEGRCQEPTCDCSGCAADAVRNRTLSPRPAGAVKIGAALAGEALGGLVCSCCARGRLTCRLTPARSSASKLAGQFRRCCESGETVPSGTASEPRWNRQLSVIVSLFAWFHGFRAQASRHARVGPCVRRRAYTCVRKAGTLEPHKLTYVYQEVRGSRAVPARFRLEPGMAARLGSGGVLPIRNILAGGYVGGSLDLGADRACSTVNRSRVAQTFGVFVPIGRVELGSIEGECLVERNGGNQPFLVVGAGRVGRVMLEGWAQGFEIAALSRLAPLPVRLARRSLGHGRPGTPPLPPFAPRPAPRALARERVGIWNGFAGHLRPFEGLSRPAGTRQRGGWGSGSGLGNRGQRRAAAAGLGGKSFGWSLELRRSGHNGGGAAHVN